MTLIMFAAVGETAVDSKAWDFTNENIQGYMKTEAGYLWVLEESVKFSFWVSFSLECVHMLQDKA